MKQTVDVFACLIALILIWSQVEAVSFKNREKYYEFEVSSRAQGKKYNGKELRQPTCKDELQNCKHYEPFCHKYNIIDERCPDTCGLCHTFSPIHCSKTIFGCCWDNETAAHGLAMEGCPACVDVDDVSCKSFQHLCPVDAQVRKLCPQTCAVPCQKCADGPYESERLCRLYKDLNFCEISPKLMRTACKKTCGFC